MLIGYEDITSRISEEPTWYTSQGYPRYCKFTYGETGVYVHYAILVEIACQNCHKRFLVGEGYDQFNWRALMTDDKDNFKTDFDKIAQNFHYGDPPNHGCVGDTMNCEDIRIVEAWEKVRELGEREINGQKFNTIKSSEWIRRADLEALDIRPEWAKPLENK